MPKFRYLMSRTSIIEESWWVEADSEDEAMEKAYDGEADNTEPAVRRWMDYADDEWTIDETECIDPLYVMVKEYEQIG
jgi:hypothetical protein